MNRNTILILLTFLATISGFAQTIPYGSNNGKYISMYNTKIYYEEYGKGTPLLLLQGGTSSIQDFSKIIPGLSKKFRVIAIDSPGQGRSEQTDSISYPLLATYFLKFIDLMKLDSVYVIGWSDGGVAALLMAAKQPEKIKRIIISGAQLGVEGYTPESQQFVSTMTPESQDTQWVKDYIAKAPAANNWKELILDLKEIWNTPVFVTAEQVRKIRSRTLVILGDRDVITLEHGIKMYNSIKGSEFLVLPNTTHSVVIERPEIFNTISIEFLSKK